jgi:hypothetical protein
MAAPEDRWPFGATDGGPESRPLVVDMTGVLIAILESTAAAEHAKAVLSEHGFDDQTLRLYTGEQIVAYDEAFRADRNLGERLVGLVVDDREAMERYVEYGRNGGAALWVLTPTREDANKVVRWLVDEKTQYLWYHSKDGVETFPMA